MAIGDSSKLPLGLLGFLGIKNGGQYPRQLLTEYRPTLDLMGLLIGANFQEANPALTTAPATGNAGSFSTPFVCPQTEIWLVTLACVRMTTAAGETGSGYMAMRRFPVTSPNVVHALSDQLGVTASNTAIPALLKYPPPLIMGPGDEIVWFATLTTGTPQMRGHFRYGVFPI
jgi:hypothetical protein